MEIYSWKKNEENLVAPKKIRFAHRIFRSPKPLWSIASFSGLTREREKICVYSIGQQFVDYQRPFFDGIFVFGVWGWGYVWQFVSKLERTQKPAIRKWSNPNSHRFVWHNLSSFHRLSPAFDLQEPQMQVADSSAGRGTLWLGPRSGWGGLALGGFEDFKKKTSELKNACHGFI